MRLDLKLVEEEKEADQALLAAEAGEEKEKDPGFLKGRRIMLVEDNELNREIAYELLSESGLIVGCGREWAGGDQASWNQAGELL